MWIVIAGEATPDAQHWPGRQLLAALDAMAWPIVLMILLGQVPGNAGLVLPTAVAVLALVALARLRKAIWSNNRYRFATWRWGRMALALIVVGAALKLAMFLR